MAIGAGPLYTNAVMGQAPSATERENARKASSTILRRDCILVEESQNLSRPESWSMHFDCTDQAPYSAEEDDDMITHTNLLHLPRKNPSHDLAFFLRTTGPTAPHRRPSKLMRPRHDAPSPKNAFRFFKGRQRRTPRKAAENQLDIEIRDEGGLLGPAKEHLIPEGVKQKVSLEGKKYFALQVADVLDSQVSISIVDGNCTNECTDHCHASTTNRPRGRPPTPGVQLSYHFASENETEKSAYNEQAAGPIRAAASNPPTPEPTSAISAADFYESDFVEHSANPPSELSCAMSNHPNRVMTSASLPLPEVPAFSTKRAEGPLTVKDMEIEHPSPRRLASHPLLLQRTSSVVDSLCPRGVADSPAPPPKSPLRLRRERRNIEDILASEPERKAPSRLAPSIRTVSDYNAEARPIKPTVVTDCTGPIKRPKSRGKTSRNQPDREERTRSRKLRDRPITTRTIDAVVNATALNTRQRLKKVRPQIQIPEFPRAPSPTRVSSSSSSNGSWKKITEFPQTLASATQTREIPSSGDKIGYSPVSPTVSSGGVTDNITLSPVMLVAEEIPLPRAKSNRRKSKAVTKEGKSYAPRPRSASIPRNSTRRRSRQGLQTPTRSTTPRREFQDDNTPPLPSPPPTRALPPTPCIASVSYPTSKEQDISATDIKDETPVSPLNGVAPEVTGLKPSRKLPHVVTQSQIPGTSTNLMTPEQMKALQRENAMLAAALTAVIRTGGTLNAPRQLEEVPRPPMVWESRIARRDAASNGGFRGNGRALEMYMNTRHASKNSF